MLLPRRGTGHGGRSLTNSHHAGFVRTRADISRHVRAQVFCSTIALAQSRNDFLLGCLPRAACRDRALGHCVLSQNRGPVAVIRVIWCRMCVRRWLASFTRSRTSIRGQRRQIPRPRCQGDTELYSPHVRLYRDNVCGDSSLARKLARRVAQIEMSPDRRLITTTGSASLRAASNAPCKCVGPFGDVLLNNGTNRVRKSRILQNAPDGLDG